MYLGIDLGTSGIKLLLVDENQRLIGSVTVPLSISRPYEFWSEQDPSDWIRALENAVALFRREYLTEFSQLKGIGLSGQMHGATLIGKDGVPLRPCILWNDSRAYQEAQCLDANRLFRDQMGNIVFPGFTAPKVRWLQECEPEVFSKIYKVLLPKDYLRYWLTGEFFSDMSDASGTAWLNVSERKWSVDLLDATGLTKEQMPELVEGTEPAGVLRASLLSAWGLAGPIVVAGGAGDNAASACGLGAVNNGQAFISLGTSGVLFVANDRFLPNPDSAVHAFCHAVPNSWHQMGVILSAADALNWYAGIVGEPADRLSVELCDNLEAPSKAVFAPYLSGERTPYNDAHVRGAFLGLSHQVDRREMTKAVIEGVSFAIKDNFEALKAAGTTIDSVTAIGGGAKSRYWLNVLATVLNIPVLLPADGDYGAAFGAARLGIIAANSVNALEICTQPPSKECIEPTMKCSSLFDDAYAKYTKLYPLIRQLN